MPVTFIDGAPRELTELENTFFNTPVTKTTFSVEEVPASVFKRLNIHKQQRLNDGHTTNINPGFFRGLSAPPPLTSQLGLGPVPAGNLPQRIPERPSNSPLPITTSITPTTDLFSRFQETGSFAPPPPDPKEVIRTTIEQLNPQQKAQLKAKIDEVNELRRRGGEIAESPEEFGLIEEKSLTDLAFDAGEFLAGAIASETLLTTSATFTSLMNTSLGQVVIGNQVFNPTIGGVLGAAGAAKLGHSVGQFGAQALGHVDNTDLDDIGGAAGGAIGAAIGSIVPGIGTLIGAGIGSAVGSFFGGLAGEKLHAGERAIAGTFAELDAFSQFSGDKDADFAKNLVLARFANPNEGDDSTADGLRGFELRALSESSIADATNRGIRELIEEGHMTKAEVQHFITHDLVLFQDAVDRAIEPTRESTFFDSVDTNPELVVPPAPAVFTDPIINEAPDFAPFIAPALDDTEIDTTTGPRPRRDSPDQSFAPLDLIEDPDIIFNSPRLT